MNGIPGWKKRPFLIRLFHWEYWTFSAIYIPIYPVFLFLCLRARSLFFYAAANPKIKNGGFLAESKKDIFALVPEKYQPKTLFFKKNTDPETVQESLGLHQFRFPLIGKPDIGGRGRGVQKLENNMQVRNYVMHARFDFHIQEFISYENEAGIFYYRIPGKQGNISGIVHKEFLKVTGDGRRTVRELMQANPRAILQLTKLEKTEPDLLGRVPADGEIITVVPYGNHARGAMFLDDSASVSNELVRVMDAVCRQIPEFYFGRMDIRYESREKLDRGESFTVLEVNGAGSEPTHIYDPAHSIFFAWKEIIRHWIILFRISRANHRLGHPYLTWKEGVQMFREDKKISDVLSA